LEDASGVNSTRFTYHGEKREALVDDDVRRIKWCDHCEWMGEYEIEIKSMGKSVDKWTPPGGGSEDPPFFRVL
jgi:hypothetical protein